jgi:Flp pilus assembly protein TadB
MVTLKDHFDALNAQRERYEETVRVLEQRHADREAAWIKEKFDLHNNLLRSWQAATTEDRANFVKTATFESLKEAFGVNTMTTAKALTLAEGKSKGLALVVAGASFVAGLVVAGIVGAPCTEVTVFAACCGGFLLVLLTLAIMRARRRKNRNRRRPF